jgi:hypothetical protein
MKKVESMVMHLNFHLDPVKENLGSKIKYQNRLDPPPIMWGFLSSHKGQKEYFKY